MYVNIGKSQINNPDPNANVQLLTYSNGTVSMSQKSKATTTSIQMWVDAFFNICKYIRNCTPGMYHRTFAVYAHCPQTNKKYGSLNK